MGMPSGATDHRRSNLPLARLPTRPCWKYRWKCEGHRQAFGPDYTKDIVFRPEFALPAGANILPLLSDRSTLTGTADTRRMAAANFMGRLRPADPDPCAVSRRRLKRKAPVAACIK